MRNKNIIYNKRVTIEYYSILRNENHFFKISEYISNYILYIIFNVYINIMKYIIYIIVYDLIYYMK